MLLTRISTFLVLLISIACSNDESDPLSSGNNKYYFIQGDEGQYLEGVNVLVIDKQNMILIERLETDRRGRFIVSSSLDQNQAVVAISSNGLRFISSDLTSLPNQIILQTDSRAKITARRLLGDVDGDGDVDQEDALLLYAHLAINYIPSVWLSIADVDKDGSITPTDVFYIGAYILDPSNPNLPSGIGEESDIEIDEAPLINHPIPDSLGFILYPDVPLQVEPGNTPQTAYPLQSVDAVRSQVGKDEFDYFRITLEDAAVIMVRGYENGEYSWIDFTLHDHTGTLIGDKGWVSDLLESHETGIHEEVQAGTYFIRVKGSGYDRNDYSLYVADSNVISTGRWQVYTTFLEDELGDVHIATLEASSPDNYHPRLIPNLILLCWQEETQVFVNWRQSLGTSFITDTREVSYRNSNSDSKQASWRVSTDETSVFVPKPIEFLQSMIGEDTLFINTWPIDRDPFSAKFDITGIDAALIQIRNSCNW